MTFISVRVQHQFHEGLHGLACISRGILHVLACANECHAEPFLKCMPTHVNPTGFHVECLLRCILTHANPHEWHAESFLKCMPTHANPHGFHVECRLKRMLAYAHLNALHAKVVGPIQL